MPTNIDFIYDSTHDVRLDNNGLVNAVPALINQGRLYVIHNPSTQRHYYIGTANDLQARFAERMQICREMGFTNLGQLDQITIFVIRLVINNQAVQPDNQGMAQAIDVEALLIRTYISRVGVPVRNVHKSNQPFVNTTGQPIHWRLINNAQIQNFGQHNYNLANLAGL
jgi:hypothetical protein